MMINAKKIEDIAKQITDSLPGGIKNFAEDAESKVKQVVQSKLSQLDVVSREDFDVQLMVLQRTREKLDVLTERVDQLEKQLAEQSQSQD